MTSRQLTRRRLLGAVGATAVLGSVGVQPGLAQDGQDGGGGPDSPYTAVYRDTIGSVVLVTVSGPRGSGGLGSGFVVDDSHVVTNNHVIQRATEGGIELQFVDETWATADLVGADPYSDLAVLEVEDMPDVASGLTFFGDEPAIGREVLVLGSPLGLDASISQGIVSGVDRVLPSPVGYSIPASIQTDAAVNPGNSGGPLVNLDGEVLGVVFAGANQTIGFAISSRLATRVVSALLEEGAYEHPFMGVGVRPVGPDLAGAIGLEEAAGVLVVQVVPGSPADGVLQAATRTDPTGGDVIVAVDDREITTQAELLSYLALETSPGDALELTVVRDGERQTVELELGTRPPPSETQPPGGPIPGGSEPPMPGGSGPSMPD